MDVNNVDNELPQQEVEKLDLNETQSLDLVTMHFMVGLAEYKKLLANLSGKEVRRVAQLLVEHPMQPEKMKVNAKELRVVHLGTKLNEAKAYLIANVLEQQRKEQEGKTNVETNTSETENSNSGESPQA